MGPFERRHVVGDYDRAGSVVDLWSLDPSSRGAATGARPLSHKDRNSLCTPTRRRMSGLDAPGGRLDSSSPRARLAAVDGAHELPPLRSALNEDGDEVRRAARPKQHFAQALVPTEHAPASAWHRLSTAWVPDHAAEGTRRAVPCSVGSGRSPECREAERDVTARDQLRSRPVGRLFGPMRRAQGKRGKHEDPCKQPKSH